MRRVLGLIFVALVLLAGVAALGVWGLARTGPENLRGRAEERLAGLLGTEVELGPVELRLSRAGLGVVAHGLRAWPTPAGPALRAERLGLQLNPWSLLAGEVELGWVTLEGAELRLRREGEGLALDVPAGPGAAVERPPPAAEEAPEKTALERLLERVPQLDLRRGRALVAAGPNGAPDLELEDLEGSIARRWIRGGAALELSGGLRSRGEAAGRFSFEGSGGTGERFSGNARLEELDLGPVGSLAPAGLRERAPEGRASGTLQLSGGPGTPLVLRLSLDAPRLGLRTPERRVDLRAVRLEGTATGALRANGSTRWSVDARARASGVDTRLAATAVELPSGGVRLEQLTLGAPLELAGLAPLLDALPEPARARARALAGHVRSGRLLDAELGWPAGGGLRASGRVEDLALVAGTGRLEDVSGSYSFEDGALALSGVGGRLAGDAAELAALWPEAERASVRGALEPIGGGRISGLELRWPLSGGLAKLELRGRVDGAQLRIGAQRRIDPLSGAVELRGGTLTLAGVAAHLDGKPLPTLDATIAGLEHLESGLRCVKPAPVPPLPGLGPLGVWVRGQQDEPPGPPSWQRLRVEADWLAHPALGCVADELVATVARPSSPDGVLRIGIERAVFAGLSVVASAEHRSEPREALRLDVRLGASGPGARTHAPAAIWSRGRAELESEKLGPWKARGARGRFRLEGDGLALEDVTLRLTPGPEIAASVIELELAQPDAVPFSANAEVTSGDFGDLLLAMSDAPEPAVSGPFVGAISLRGALRPGHPTLGDADGGFSLHVRDGVIRQRFRLFLAVAMVSETLNPFRERGTIRFGAMDVEGTLQGGSWQAETAQIDGPALRVLASGRVGAVEPNPVEGVMALFFFRTVDSAIRAVPIMNRVLLGTDKNLLGTYVELSGPWNDMQARALPVKSLASGPASVVLEGVPTALQQGVRAIQSLLEVTPTPSLPSPSVPSLPRRPLGPSADEKAES